MDTLLPSRVSTFGISVLSGVQLCICQRVKCGTPIKARLYSSTCAADYKVGRIRYLDAQIAKDARSSAKDVHFCCVAIRFDPSENPAIDRACNTIGKLRVGSEFSADVG